ncbi:hypothetical protein [Vibrio tritonius]|uniref:hypothetical protein n=1 Tax=Vibrio tritonius TaxID=1435069 RepID=UPI00315D1B82
MKVDEDIRFIDRFQVSTKDDLLLSELSFTVRHFLSERDSLYITEVRVEHDHPCPLIESFKFEVSNGEQTRPHSILDFILPKNLRGHRVGMFVLHKVYGYLDDKIKAVNPVVNGTLVEKDNAPNRDHMYKRLIGYGLDSRAQFDVDEEGYGGFEGVFHDVGTTWEQSLNVKFLGRVPILLS